MVYVTLCQLIETEQGQKNFRGNMNSQRLMYALNAHYRSRSFQIFGQAQVAQVFRGNLRNGFEEFVKGYQVGRSEAPIMEETFASSAMLE